MTAGADLVTSREAGGTNALIHVKLTCSSLKKKLNYFLKKNGLCFFFDEEEEGIIYCVDEKCLIVLTF